MWYHVVYKFHAARHSKHILFVHILTHYILYAFVSNFILLNKNYNFLRVEFRNKFVNCLRMPHSHICTTIIGIKFIRANSNMASKQSA